MEFFGVLAAIKYQEDDGCFWLGLRPHCERKIFRENSPKVFEYCAGDFRRLPDEVKSREIFFQKAVFQTRNLRRTIRKPERGRQGLQAGKKVRNSRLASQAFLETALEFGFGKSGFRI